MVSKDESKCIETTSVVASLAGTPGETVLAATCSLLAVKEGGVPGENFLLADLSGAGTCLSIFKLPKNTFLYILNFEEGRLK